MIRYRDAYEPTDFFDDDYSESEYLEDFVRNNVGDYLDGYTFEFMRGYDEL